MNTSLFPHEHFSTATTDDSSKQQAMHIGHLSYCLKKQQKKTLKKILIVLFFIIFYYFFPPHMQQNVHANLLTVVITKTINIGCNYLTQVEKDVIVARG